MAINYSLSARLSNPSDKNSEKKVFPCAQVHEVISLQELAKHISGHGSPYTRDIIVGVLTAAVDCIREQLLLGNKVKLGEMGAFYISLRSEGVDKVEDFNPAYHIKALMVRWDRGNNFQNLITEAKFNYSTTRKKQSLSKKEEKEAVNAELGVSGNNGGNGDSGDVTD